MTGQVALGASPALRVQSQRSSATGNTRVPSVHLGEGNAFLMAQEESRHCRTNQFNGPY
jgi:hypothetical protein